MSGARPLYLAAAFILEKGLLAEELQRVVESMRDAAHEAGVQLVTGDTKVVNRGKGDKIFITTTGMGVIEGRCEISASRARAGRQDSGQRIHRRPWHGDHVATREPGVRRRYRKRLCAAATRWSAPCSRYSGRRRVPDSRLRDPTRGGVATTLNEIAARSNVGMLLDEDAIPVRDAVQGACEMLGLDPLYVANEGKLVAVVAPEAARFPAGANARAPARQRRLHHRRSGARARRHGPHEDIRLEAPASST